MTPEVCRAFARYNRWMNAKVYDASSRLTDEERTRDRGAFFGSVHRTLNHLLVADRIWLSRLEGKRPEPGFMAPGGIKALDQELHADFAALRRERAEVDDALEAWAETITADELARVVRMIRRGVEADVTVWWAVAQMFNHQTHHRGQITTLLSQAGQDPGMTDLFAMLMEEEARS